MALRLSVSVLGTYNWARQLIFSIFSATKKETLLKEVEELKAQLQRAEERSFFQEQKVTELSTNLESEVNENESLWNQVEYLTGELHRAKAQTQQQSNLFCEERAKCFEEQTLRIQLGEQLEETKQQLAHQKIQEDVLVNKEKETRSELETLKVSCQEIHQRYETELMAEKQKSDTLQQQLATEKKSRAERESEYQEQIQRLKAQQDALQQKVEQELKLLQQGGSERETIFCREFEDLKIKVHKQTTTNVEEEVNQALHTETAQLRDELKDDVCEQPEEQEEEEESLPNLQEPEPLEEAQDPEQKAPEKKKAPSLWKRTDHFLGLRLKKKEKQEKESTSN